MRADIRPLPIPIQPEHPHENGLGYLMRVAQHNGMTLKSMFAWLDIGRSSVLELDGAARLAYAVSAPPSWLMQRLVIQGTVGRRRAKEWAGTAWSCSLALRGTHPQICPKCLRQQRLCDLAWELSGAVACPHHRCLLHDSCHHCGEPLTWFRPAVDVCQCGHYLSMAPTIPLEREELRWTTCLLSRAGLRAPMEDGLPEWCGMVSADALTAIVHAFGIRNSPHTKISAAAAQRPASPAEMHATLQRGLHRLRELEAGEPCARVLRTLVYEEGLDRLADRGADAADRDLARQFLDWLHDVPRSGLSLSGRRARKQLSLF